jgi:UDPglucose 6-dehydrogenase
MKHSIGVVGQGFVGGSLSTVFAEKGISVYAFDKAGKYNTSVKETTSIKNLVEKCESEATNFTGIYFVCVPTPMYEDGGADLRIVESVLQELADIPGDRIAVVKSTVPPGSCSTWNSMFNSSGLSIVFNPEFLTEANALDDMRHQTRIVLGGSKLALDRVKNLYRTAFPDVPILKTSKIATAEMVKYFTNLHLAVRVILSCELYQLCDALLNNGIEVDFERVVEFANFDKRLGGSHMNVPGNDGVMGARGHCFPKDMNALISLMKHLNVSPTVLEAAWKKNNEVVPTEHRDWEKMIGRAVSKRNE